jgi:predicted nucleic-acid-binding protein
MTYYIDTNYFLRLFLDDNRKQTQKVKELFLEGSTGKINLKSSVVVFLEVYWVLKSFYSFSKDQVLDALIAILKMDFIEFEKEEIMFLAIELFKKKNLNLEDCFHLAYSLEDNGYGKTTKLATFDKKLENVYKKL